MLKAKLHSNVSQMPMSIASALRHPNASDFMAAFASEIASLQEMSTFIPYNDNVNLIPKGSLLSSKAIFNIVYNPDGTFKKFKARLVARGDQLKNILIQTPMQAPLVLPLFVFFLLSLLKTILI